MRLAIVVALSLIVACAYNATLLFGLGMPLTATVFTLLVPALALVFALVLLRKHPRKSETALLLLVAALLLQAGMMPLAEALPDQQLAGPG